MEKWSKYNLNKNLINVLKERYFIEPTNIQKEFLSFLNQDYDVVAASKTGSGKTLCYCLSILNDLLKELETNKKIEEIVYSLVIVPTRELCNQVYEEFTNLNKFTKKNIRIASLIGGISKEKQLRLINSKPNILISTPGRLYDFIFNENNKYLNTLASIKYLVLDEADRIIELGQFKELSEILNFIYEGVISKDKVNDEMKDINFDLNYTNEIEGIIKNDPLMKNASFKILGANNDESLDLKLKNLIRLNSKLRKTYIISATIGKTFLTSRMNNKHLKKLSKKKHENNEINSYSKIKDVISKIKFNFELKIIDLTKETTLPETLKISKIHCNSEEKLYYLYHLINEYKNKTIIVFCNSINSTKKISKILENLDIDNSALHSMQQQRQRFKKLDYIKKHKRNILICTDLGSRGLDIPSVDLVVHYHLSRDMDTFVHRSGRTARIGKQGNTILLIDTNDYKRFSQFKDDLIQENLLNLKINLSKIQNIKSVVDKAKELERQTHLIDKEKREDKWMKKLAKDADIVYEKEPNTEINIKSKKIWKFEKKMHKLNLKKKEDSYNKISTFLTLGEINDIRDKMKNKRSK